MPGRIEMRERLDDVESAAVTKLAAASTEADGVAPLNEAAVLRLRDGGGQTRHLLLTADGPDTPDHVVGYAQLDLADADGAGAELVVHPAARGHGHGRALLTETIAATDRRLHVWAHGDHPAARALAAATGFAEVRRLLQLRRSLSEPLPSAPLPDGVRLRAFEPGRDETGWLALNALAFAAHPEQGRWTEADLAARMQEPWFDPAGFLVATRDETMVGFHWTKVHGGEPAGAGQPPDDGRIGEVYVVGVHPGHQGGGLGRALTVAGLDWLRGRGLGQAMLYVESDNLPALAVYRGIGFTLWRTDVMYRREGDRNPPGGN